MMLVTFISLLITNSIKSKGDFDTQMWISNNSGLISGITMLVSLSFVIIAYLVLFIKTDELVFKYKKKMWLIFPAGAFLAISLNVFITKLSKYFEWAQYEDNSLRTEIPLIMGIFIYVILSPLLEELLFRWLMYGRMKKMLNTGMSIFISAFFFGFYHGVLIQGIYAFIMGLLMAVLYEWSGTILAAFLFHAAANLFVYLLAYLPDNLISIIASMPSAIIMFVSGLALILVYKRLAEK